ncbi:hypothetical protein LG634_21145 [Streptomyces bambusae]|uniref:hypothetical protein n=1 Tax=Streptomyces bambusae TaxID=1550616 RepID=UPI001CFE9DDA|nr:hypothetical protein [Streptomyces bambusae]MCB5167336.1 hypothetical protein [Streptomyces bambusae]
MASAGQGLVQDTGITVQESTETSEEIAEYWTPERLRNLPAAGMPNVVVPD